MTDEQPEVRIPKFNVVERGTISYDDDKLTIDHESPAPPSPPDEAAVEAVNQLILAKQLSGRSDSAARVITDAYSDQLGRMVKDFAAEGVKNVELMEQLASERAVREKLVEALKDVVPSTRCQYHNKDCRCPGCISYAALAEAEKLETADA